MEKIAGYIDYLKYFWCGCFILKYNKFIYSKKYTESLLDSYHKLKLENHQNTHINTDFFEENRFSVWLTKIKTKHRNFC